jgi:endonuclease G
MQISRIATSLLLALGLTPAWAAETACPLHYAGAQAPDIERDSLRQGARALCFSAFGVVHSAVSRTPLWSAQYLTPARVAKAATLERKDAFHEETLLPEAERAELEDYRASGYDRGHLSPNHDMPDLKSQKESFSLANIVPQAPWANRGQWGDLEEAVRKRVKTGRSLHVISGPLFEGSQLAQLDGRVLVPSAMFKLVCDLKARQLVAFVLSNELKPAVVPRYQAVSLVELEQRLGVKLLPGVPDAAAFGKLTLPGVSVASQ